MTETEMKILSYMGKADQGVYLTKLEKELGIVRPVLYENTRNLLKKGLVKPEKRGVEVYYSSTAQGSALTWALTDLPELTKFYEEHVVPKEERRRLQAREETPISQRGKGTDQDIMKTLDELEQAMQVKRKSRQSIGGQDQYELVRSTSWPNIIMIELEFAVDYEEPSWYYVEKVLYEFENNGALIVDHKPHVGLGDNTLRITFLLDLKDSKIPAEELLSKIRKLQTVKSVRHEAFNISLIMGLINYFSKFIEKRGAKITSSQSNERKSTS